jgi:uncharacterized protein (TIGR02996 family)
MTDTERAFLRAICEQPDEDTPRLVFADYLDEQGGEVNALWAELIRVQVPLARGPGADRERLAARERELEPALVAVWPERMGLSKGLLWQNWTRGLPLTLDGWGTTIRAARPMFANRVPLREFNMHSVTDADLVEFVTWPELTLVTKLGVWTEVGEITERGIVALAECEHLSNLERLRMEWVRYTDRAMEAFLDSPHLGNVVSVKMVGRGFTTLSEDIRQRSQGRFGRWNVR